MKNQKTAKMLSLSMLLSVLVWSPVLGGNKEYADQQQIESNGEYGSASVTANPGQIFRPEIKGRLTRVDLELQKVYGTANDNTLIPPGDLIVEIITVPENDIMTNPTFDVLASATINQADISEQTPAWYQVRFATPVVLNRDSRYAILLRVAGQIPDLTDGTSASYSWYLSSDEVTDPYSSGQFFFTQGNSTSYWHWMRPMAPRYIDATFVTYMAHGHN